jgi:hypothetical protein
MSDLRPKICDGSLPLNQLVPKVAYLVLHRASVAIDLAGHGSR